MYKQGLKVGDIKKVIKLANAFDEAYRAYMTCEEKDEPEKDKAMNETWNTFCGAVLVKPEDFTLDKITKEKVGEIVKGFFTPSLTLLT